jgi:hypothetical protein
LYNISPIRILLTIIVKICFEFELIENYTIAGKKIFLKALSRIQHFKGIAPNIPLPPQPIITRWGTWLSAVFYYSEHFETIKEILQDLDEEDASSIKITKALLQDDTIRADLVFITSNFSSIPETITKLESRNSPLVHSLKLFDKTIDGISAIEGPKGDVIRQKCV